MGYFSDVRDFLEGMEGGDNVKKQKPAAFLSEFSGLVEEILTKIADQLSTEDLRNFRLVSHLFYSASLAPWRQKTIPRLNFANPTFFYHSVSSKPQMLMLDEALDLPIEKDDLLKLGQYPFTELQIYHWDYKVDRGQTHDQFIRQFFIKFGSSLVHLDLRQCDSIGAPTMIQNLKYCGHLKSLVLNDCLVYDYTKEVKQYVEKDYKIKYLNGLTVTHLSIDALSDPKMVPQKIKCFAILRQLPFLQELTIHLNNPLRSHFFWSPSGFLESLRSYRNRVKNDLLQVIIHGVFNFQGTINEFFEAIVPIESWYTFVEPPRFQKALRRKAKKLWEMIIDHTRATPFTNVFHPLFPFGIEVPSLRKIYFNGNVTNSFNFLYFMPALEKIVIRLHAHHDDHDYDELSSYKTKTGGKMSQDFVENTLDIYKLQLEMEYLTYLEIDSYFKKDSLSVLVKFFPRLTVLKMVVQSNEMFRFICDNWLDLTEFIVLPGSRVDDSGITGLEKEEKSIQYPNLTYLEDLESFEISSKHLLTDLSVITAFVVMNSLKKLMIHAPTNFSPFSRNWLNDKFGSWMIKEERFGKCKSVCEAVDFSVF